MKFNAFQRRDDLCSKGQSRLLYCPDYGTILRDQKGWWATNDIRYHRVGVEPNDTLVQPTLGPFKTAQDAFRAYVLVKNDAPNQGV